MTFVKNNLVILIAAALIFIAGSCDKFRKKELANNSKKTFREFNLDETGDTYIDMSAYTKGIVWVNGHNLGRYWNVGPQYRLYCPEPWLKKGNNEILIFDLHQLEAAPVKGVKELD